MKRLEWKQPALDDRESIIKFIAQDNPGAAIELDDEIERQAEKVSQGRGASRPGRVLGTREIVAHPNYVIVYQDVGDVMQVLRVLHAAMQWPQKQPRRGTGRR